MRPVHTVTEVRAAEVALMATLPEGTLMGRAADGLARCCAQLLGRVYGARVVLLVGSGNNGQDAVWAGRRLAARGAHVTVLNVADPAAAEQADASLARGIDLVVDAIVGIGGTGPLRPAAAALVEQLAGCGAWRVAVDLPSGVDADTGHIAGAAFEADVTVTFGCLKPGLVLDPGRSAAGIVELVDIGLGPWLPAPGITQLGAPDLEQGWPWPGPADDKFSRGVLGVVAGSDAYPGAAVLCVGGALRAGAGLVRFLGPKAPSTAVRLRWPEAVHGNGRVQAYVVGPGLGTGPESAERLLEVLASDVPVVVDADGLTVLAHHKDWVRPRRALTILTPHAGEFGRFGRPPGDDRVAAARTLAADLGAVVLLKGSTTVVAHPDGHVQVNPTGSPWLATAGSGDVLAGIIGALLAAGADAGAPAYGAFVHGLAARRASFGGPMTALDLVGAVPGAIASLRDADQAIPEG